MEQSPKYVTLRVDEDIHDDARITRAKHGLTWTEFLEQAATTLDPKEGGN